MARDYANELAALSGGGDVQQGPMAQVLMQMAKMLPKNEYRQEYDDWQREQSNLRQYKSRLRQFYMQKFPGRAPEEIEKTIESTPIERTGKDKDRYERMQRRGTPNPGEAPSGKPLPRSFIPGQSSRDTGQRYAEADTGVKSDAAEAEVNRAMESGAESGPDAPVQAIMQQIDALSDEQRDALLQNYRFQGQTMPTNRDRAVRESMPTDSMIEEYARRYGQ